MSITDEGKIQVDVCTNSSEIAICAEVDFSNISVCVDFDSFGIRETLCPIIDCVDGGNAFTTTFPAINGFLKGGSA